MIIDIKENLKKVTLFSKLESQELYSIEKLINVVNFSKGEAVFNYGDYPVQLHILFVGQLKSVRYSKEGKEIVMHPINSGQLFADIPTFLDIPYTGTALAIKKSIVGKFNHKNFLNLLQKQPDIALKIMGMMALRTKELLSRIEDYTAYTPLERLARFFIKLNKKQQSKTIFIPMGKADIARTLGIAPETFSRGLSELVADKIIEVEGKRIQIIDFNRLNIIGCMEE